MAARDGGAQCLVCMTATADRCSTSPSISPQRPGSHHPGCATAAALTEARACSVSPSGLNLSGWSLPFTAHRLLCVTTTKMSQTLAACVSLVKSCRKTCGRLVP